MADSTKMTKATPQEIVVATLAGLFAPLLAIYLIVQLVDRIQSQQAAPDGVQIVDERISANIKPVAMLDAVDANAPKVEKMGDQVYGEVCTSCHAAGALGAPKYENKGDWAPRIGKGLETLTKHAIEGFNQMPARGGNPDLSDTEVIRAIVYMTNAAGAKFTAPEAPAPVVAAAVPGAVAVAPAAPAADLVKGKAVYEQVCAACHVAGVAGAPKMGDKAGWAPRIGTGLEALYTSALKGKGAMPAKGGQDLPDADVKSAVDYMVSENK
jgi:cytochrome c5